MLTGTGNNTRIIKWYALFFASAFVAAGCGDAFLNDGTLFDYESPLSFEAEGPELSGLFKPDFSGHGFRLEGIISDDPVFDRAGFMIDSVSVPSMEVRVSTEGNWSEWIPVTVNWSEDILHTAHADLPHGGEEMQIRLLDMDPEDISFVAVEGFVYEPDIIDEHEIEEGLDTHVQALAANRGVDVPRSGWNARPSRCSAGHSIRMITVHHTDTPNNDTSSMAARMRSMQNYHMNSRGFCDIGYHFNIGQDGRVYQARAERFRGAHVLNQNTNNGGVSFIGNFTNVTPSGSMMSAGAKIINAIGCHYNFSLNRSSVKGHRELGQTACPGNALYNRMGDLVSHAANMSCTGGHTPMPDPDPGPGDGSGSQPGDPAPGGGNAILQGIVYVNGDTSNRITNATVTVNGQSTSVNRNGYYTINLPAGTHNITASAPGYHSNTVQRHVPAGSQTWGSVPLRPHASTGGPQNLGRLVGVIYEAPNAMDRLANATVTLSNGSSTVTGRDGYFSFDVPAGTYTVTASRPGYGRGSVTRRVNAGETRWGSVALSKENSLGELVGVIFEEPSTSNRLSGATVRLPDGRTSTTGADGTYRFEVNAGTYRITASKPGFSSATVIRTVATGVTTWASIGLNRTGSTGPDGGTGTITGMVYVKPDTSDRIPGARVWTSTGQSTVTNSQGVYTLSNVPAGELNVFAGAAGYTNGLVKRNLPAGQKIFATIGLGIGSGGPGQEPDNGSECPDGEHMVNGQCVEYGEGMYGAMINLIEPVNEEETGPDPEFEWENISEEVAAGNSFRYVVFVIDEDGEQTFEFEEPGQIGGTTRTSFDLTLSAGFWWWGVYAITNGSDDVIAASTFNDDEAGIDSIFEVVAGYLLPLECGFSATISQGNNGSYSHQGMSQYAYDFSLNSGTPVVAMRAGTVSMISNAVQPGDPCYNGGGPECGSGNYVLLAHDDGTDTLYLHLNDATVNTGDTVEAGEEIGLSGNTGHSTGPHLHAQRQERCGSSYCQSIPLVFDDWPENGGVPQTNDVVTSGNCP